MLHRSFSCYRGITLMFVFIYIYIYIYVCSIFIYNNKYYVVYYETYNSISTAVSLLSNTYSQYLACVNCTSIYTCTSEFHSFIITTIMHNDSILLTYVFSIFQKISRKFLKIWIFLILIIKCIYTIT